MRAPRRVTVTGWGAHHALGVGSRAAVMAARARQLELRATPARDAAGEAIAAATSRSADARGGPAGSADAEAIVAALAGDAAAEAAAGGPRATPALIVCAAPPEVSDGLLGAIAERLGRPVDPRSVVVRGGATAFATALGAARSLLLDGAPEVLAGAVDTPRLPGKLERLARAGVLHVTGSAHGRVPAEAAAFLRLALRADHAGRPRLAAVERGAELADREGALGRMIRRAEGAVAAGPVRLLVDVTSDPPRARAWLRDREAMLEGGAGGVADAVEVWSDDAGDVDVASGAWLSVVAMVTARTGAVPGGGAVVGLRDDPGPDGSEPGAVATIAWDLPRPGGDFAASTARAVAREVAPRRSGRGGWAPAHRDRLLRSLLEDVGSLGLLLAPGDAGPDRNASAARLLQALDAIAAIAIPGPSAPAHPDVLAAVRAYGAEVSPPDRARRFAVRFVEAHLVQRGAARGG